MGTKVRLEGLTLTVKDVKRSLDFYTKKLGFRCEVNAAPYFAMIRVGGDQGGTIGLLALSEGKKEGVAATTARQKRAIHVELSTDDFDGLYKVLRGKGVKFHAPPHDEPWERSTTAFDPDGYAVEFAQGRRGKNKPKK
jgi:catechol 2,3-dioxygenase-like lactoylglutathione lyase family enzyme